MSKTIIQLGDGRLSKSDILRKNSDFLYVKEQSKRYVGKYIVVNVVSAKDNRLKLGVIASRRFNRSAVVRNRAKRLIRESYRRLKVGIDPPIWIVIIARKYISEAQLHSVQQELIRLLIKARVLTNYRPNT